jgi:hypothetical protein
MKKRNRSIDRTDAFEALNVRDDQLVQKVSNAGLTVLRFTEYGFTALNLHMLS